ncbi:hypothetical protein DFH09DRAFT_1376460 [Mycena vulgaris]|nr:hypothetical protein DFH09DRAFT_1376460 [Mycena vulgaris]
MAKRMRRQSPEDTSRSQSSDSQSGMADTEEPEATSPRAPCSPGTVRFPTTAMREEVGRSIGLSARKVQIWFQNQRQKGPAPRKPERQLPIGPAPVRLVPKYASCVCVGAHLPSMESAKGGPFPMRTAGIRPRSTSDPWRHRLTVGSWDARALHATRAPHPSLASDDPYSRDLPAPHLPLPPHARRRPLAHAPAPPLQPAFPAPRYAFIHARALRAHDPSHASYLTSPSPSPTFAHALPAQQPPYSSAALGLPPPFTLQPQPQWDSAQRPHSASWSRSGSTSHSARDSSSSPPTSFLSEPARDEDGDTPRLGPALPSRAGRYDPVRAVFVPYSPTTSDAPLAESSSTPPA